LVCILPSSNVVLPACRSPMRAGLVLCTLSLLTVVPLGIGCVVFTDAHTSVSCICVNYLYRRCGGTWPVVPLVFCTLYAISSTPLRQPFSPKRGPLAVLYFVCLRAPLLQKFISIFRYVHSVVSQILLSLSSVIILSTILGHE